MMIKIQTGKIVLHYYIERFGTLLFIEEICYNFNEMINQSSNLILITKWLLNFDPCDIRMHSLTSTYALHFPFAINHCSYLMTFL